MALQGALADIDTLQTVVDEINSSGTGLVTASEEDFGVELRRELDKMNERWADIKKMSQVQNNLLKESLGKGVIAFLYNNNQLATMAEYIQAPC